MQIEVRTDNNTVGSASLIAQVESAVTRTLSRFSDRITHVEVHLGDESGRRRGPEDKRCMMEARLEGRKPIAVTHHAATLAKAMDGAAHKLDKLIESALGRVRSEHRRESEELSSEDAILTEADEPDDDAGKQDPRAQTPA